MTVSPSIIREYTTFLLPCCLEKFCTHADLINSVAATFLAFMGLWLLLDVIHFVLWIRKKPYLRSFALVNVMGLIFSVVVIITSIVGIAKSAQSPGGMAVIIALLYGQTPFQMKLNSRKHHADSAFTVCHTSACLSTPCVVIYANGKPIYEVTIRQHSIQDNRWK